MQPLQDDLTQILKILFLEKATWACSTYTIFTQLVLPLSPQESNPNPKAPQNGNKIFHIVDGENPVLPAHIPGTPKKQSILGGAGFPPSTVEQRNDGLAQQEGPQPFQRGSSQFCQALIKPLTLINLNPQTFHAICGDSGQYWQIRNRRPDPSSQTKPHVQVPVGVIRMTYMERATNQNMPLGFKNHPTT